MSSRQRAHLDPQWFAVRLERSRHRHSSSLASLATPLWDISGWKYTLIYVLFNSISDVMSVHPPTQPIVRRHTHRRNT